MCRRRIEAGIIRSTGPMFTSSVWIRTIHLKVRHAAMGAMLRWLENDLRATRKFWRVAAFHHPPYASGFYRNDPLSSLAWQHIVPILEAYGVQLVLNGHEHSYQRSYDIRAGAALPRGTGTLYMTSGGGGAALYPVTSHPLIAFGSSTYH
jgi:acid phosphatase type 7